MLVIEDRVRLRFRHSAMRTTLNLSAEALAKVRQLAQQRRKTLGAVASELILQALEPDEGTRGPQRRTDLSRVWKRPA